MLRLRHVVVLASVTLVLGLIRFGHHTPDSPHYLEVAGYFRGDVPLAELDTPYAYRVLAPGLASLLPLSDLTVAFAALNLVCTFIAYLVFARLLARLFDNATEFAVGLLLLVISFPTVNYASGVLSDPLGFLMVVGAGLALLAERFIVFAVVVSLGVLARESVAAMVPAAALYLFLLRSDAQLRRVWPYALAAICAPVVAFIAPRIWFGHEAQYVWVPELSRLAGNLVRPVSLATTLLTAGPVAVVLVAGLAWRGAGWWTELPRRHRAWYIAVNVAGGTVFVYSVVAAFMSGRFFWPLYVPLIPLAVLASRGTPLYERVLAPVAHWLFGGKKKA